MGLAQPSWNGAITGGIIYSELVSHELVLPGQMDSLPGATPEHWLVFSVLMNAIETLEAHYLRSFSNDLDNPKVVESQILVTEVEMWLNGRGNPDYVFPFYFICEVFHLNPGATRQAIWKRIHALTEPQRAYHEVHI